SRIDSTLGKMSRPDSSYARRRAVPNILSADVGFRRLWIGDVLSKVGAACRLALGPDHPAALPGRVRGRSGLGHLRTCSSAPTLWAWWVASASWRPTGGSRSTARSVSLP